MARLKDSDIANIIAAEEGAAIGYLGDGSKIQQNRALLMRYYNQEPFGDEIDGLSKVVTSDVSDVVETMVPLLMRIFCQGKYIAKFSSSHAQYEEEAEQKTHYSHWVFNELHDGVLILADMIKDALYQYTGVVKVWWDPSEQSELREYTNLREEDFVSLSIDPSFEIDEKQDKAGPNGELLFDVKGRFIRSKGRPRIENVAPDELLISRRARSFDNPPFIGQRSPRTRSELIEMGFDKKVVMKLTANSVTDNTVRIERNADLEYDFETNPTNDKSKDIIYLGEYYTFMDVDGDGISELWQVFYADGHVLEKNRVSCDPYCVAVPIRIPHRAIGSCPAEQVADLQLLKSTLFRQLLNNIYLTNFQRYLVNDRVDTDDFSQPAAGGYVRVEGGAPVRDSVEPIPVQSLIGDILNTIEYVDTMREVRTGVTRYSQGIDSEILNKTATAFAGQRDSSQMRVELIARQLVPAVKKIFGKIIEVATDHQDEEIEIMVTGKPLKIDPSVWRGQAHCYVDVGTGATDRDAKIQSYILLLNELKMQKELQSPIVDDKKIYNIMAGLVKESGLKDPAMFVNDPERPEEQVMAENEQLKAQLQQMEVTIQQLQQAAQLTEVEKIKQEGMNQRELLKTQSKDQIARDKARLEESAQNDDMALTLAKILADIRKAEAQTGKDIDENVL